MNLAGIWTIHSSDAATMTHRFLQIISLNWMASLQAKDSLWHHSLNFSQYSYDPN